jgi:hypothetical protein
VHRRWQIGIGSTATVVLTGVSGALINELHGGWGWIVAAAAVVLMAALLTGWLALRTGDAETAQHLSNGAVEAGRDIHGAVRTETVGPSVERSSHGPCDLLGPGAVKAGRDIRGEVTTRTENYPQHTS